jgi:hypothetical protein
MEHRGVTFTVVQTISKGWRWAVVIGEREIAGTTIKRDAAILRAKQSIDDLLWRRERPKISD